VILSRRGLLGSALTALPLDVSAQTRKNKPDTWATYRNARYGMSIQYPSRFRPGPPARQQ